MGKKYLLLPLQRYNLSYPKILWVGRLLQSGKLPLIAGQVLNNRYRITRLLGQGGFGAVYRAWDLSFSLAVAVKENTETSPEGQRQFLREAQLLRTLRHPNLPVVTDIFSIPGQGQYLVMDYVEGDDLQEMLDRNPGKPLPEAQALGWIAEICDALTYLHSQNPPVDPPRYQARQYQDHPAGQSHAGRFWHCQGVRHPVHHHAWSARLHRGLLAARAVRAGAHRCTERCVRPGRHGIHPADRGGAARIHRGGLGQPAAARASPHTEPAPVAGSLSAALAGALQPSRAQRTRTILDFKSALNAVVAAPTIQAQSWRSASPPASAQPAAPTPAGPRLSRWGWAIGLVGLALLAVRFGLAPAWRVGRGSCLHRCQPGRRARLPRSLSVPAATITPVSPVPTLTFTLSLPPSATPTQTETPATTGLPTEFTDEFGIRMALVPAGPFQMGSEQGISDELPVHTVELGDYYVDVTEVTNASFAAFLNAQGNQSEGGVTWLNAGDYARIHQVSGEWQPDASYADHPVVEVSWYGAKAYCAWRGARLPSEAEWEKAARGGLEGKLYPWGDENPLCQPGASNGAQFADCGGQTVAVGSYAPNRYGLFDMVGNVREWVSSLYQSYPFDPRDGREDLSASGNRVVQGGGWYNDTGYLRIANRYNIDPAVSNIDLGFRCVRYPLPAQAETSMLASLPAEFTDEFGIAMALVPAGPFQMGSAAGRGSDEQPVHTVELGHYYMDVTEVTNASFACLSQRPGQPAGRWGFMAGCRDRACTHSSITEINGNPMLVIPITQWSW